MPAVANPRVVLAKLPGDSLPVAGEHLVLDKSHEIDLDTVPLNGGYLSKTLLLRHVQTPNLCLESSSLCL